MATVIRAEISAKNKYWIDKHRHYELKHFCLQYPIWKQLHAEALDSCISAAKLENESSTNIPSDITAKYAMKKAMYSEKIKLIEWAAKGADEVLYPYILRAVTEGLSYTYLKTRLNIPCGKDMYYDRYRRFFWLLSESRN
jgi:hypothetical protein